MIRSKMQTVSTRSAHAESSKSSMRFATEGYPKLTVFNDGEIYLPMKKIGKNNPKEAEIKAANALREDWNRMADEALVAGVEEALIKQVKQEEITE